MVKPDRVPVSLTTWKLTNDRSFGFRELANAGLELGGYDAPKTKFLFTVSFDTSLQLPIEPGSDNMSLNKYACKNVSRPNININYVEVNSYNYRYKVATRTDYGAVTISFYDDNKNTAHTLLRAYLNAVSPISIRESGDSYYLRNDDIQAWASLGPLPTNDADGLIKTMRVTHHYNSGYRPTSDYFSRVHYDYINPKIQSFNWDELDMGTSEAPVISATFVYDSVNIIEEHNEGTVGGNVTNG
ncbi:hypothetical protein Xoosp13_319 [Xanthomonas phage Xoo-sp13]|nr:hypothetical protein Xoosp13_319 [Xanthomonas phage Xoo-sp13]